MRKIPLSDFKLSNMIIEKLSQKSILTEEISKISNKSTKDIKKKKKSVKSNKNEESKDEINKEEE